MDEEDDLESNSHQDLTLNPPQSSNPNSDESPFSSVLFRDPDDEEEEEEEAADEEDDEIYGNEDRKPALNALPRSSTTPAPVPTPTADPPAPLAPHINPSSHISSQFYTFNRDSHALMVRCILEGCLATLDEIHGATPAPVLKSWHSVWKDRNEDTAYLTAWKRIQDKLMAHLDPAARSLPALFFKNSSSAAEDYVHVPRTNPLLHCSGVPLGVHQIEEVAALRFSAIPVTCLSVKVLSLLIVGPSRCPSTSTPPRAPIASAASASMSL